MGGVSTPGPNLRQWVENCGLEEIEERVFDLDIGKRCKDRVMAKISIRNLLELIARFKSAAECEIHKRPLLFPFSLVRVLEG
jgi:hypothetical protein